MQTSAYVNALTPQVAASSLALVGNPTSNLQGFLPTPILSWLENMRKALAVPTLNSFSPFSSLTSTKFFQGFPFNYLFRKRLFKV